MSKENNLGSALAGVPDFTFVVLKKNNLSIFYLRTPFQVERVSKQFSVVPFHAPPEEITDLSRFRYKAVLYYDDPKLFFEQLQFRDISALFASITDDIMIVVSAEYSKEFKEHLEKLSKKLLSGGGGFLSALLGGGNKQAMGTTTDFELKSKINKKLSQINYKTTITIYATNKIFLETAIQLFTHAIVPSPEVKIFPLKKKEKLEILPDKKYFMSINDSELDDFLIIPEINSKLGSSANLPSVRFAIQPDDIVIGKNELGYEVPVSMPELLSHAYIIGMTGAGKTNTLKVLSTKIIEKWIDRSALWVIDPHGSMAKELLTSIDAIPGGDVNLYLKYRAILKYFPDAKIDLVKVIPLGTSDEEAERIKMGTHEHVIDIRPARDGYILVDDKKHGVILPDTPDERAQEILKEYPDAFDLRGKPKIYYFDPLEVQFQINPLDVPAVSEDSDIHIMNLINEMRGIFEKIFSLDMTKAANVQMLISLGIQATFEIKMAKEGRPPTLPELFDFLKELFLRIQAREPIDDLLEGIQTDTVKELLRLIPMMQSQSLVSTINRLKEFAIVPRIREMFSGNTIDFLELTQPGNIVIWALSKSNIPESLNELIMGIIMMRLWFIAKYRASLTEAYSIGKINEKHEITPVFVIIDEFQNIQKLQLVDTILTEARKFGIHLIMAHQNLKQLDEKLLDTVLNNTALQIFMRTQGGDNEKLAKHIKYDFREEIAAILPSLGKGEAVVKKTAMRPGESDYPPQKVKIFKAPDPYLSPRYIYDVLQLMKARYSVKAAPASAEGQMTTVENERPKNIEQTIEKVSKNVEFYVALYSIIKNDPKPFDFADEKGAMKSVAGASVGLRAPVFSRIVNDMAEKGYIIVRTIRPQGMPGRPKEYLKLTPKGVEELIGSIETVAPSPEGQFLIKKVIEQYIKESQAIIAPIIPVQVGEAPDLLFMPIKKNGKHFQIEPKYAWVVEAESPQEVAQKPQQVSKNMVKDVNHRFLRIDSVTYKDSIEKLKSIKDSVPPVFAEKVKVGYYDPETDKVIDAESNDVMKPPAILDEISVV